MPRRSPPAKRRSQPKRKLTNPEDQSEANEKPAAKKSKYKNGQAQVEEPVAIPDDQTLEPSPAKKQPARPGRTRKAQEDADATRADTPVAASMEEDASPAVMPRPRALAKGKGQANATKGRAQMIQPTWYLCGACLINRPASTQKIDGTCEYCTSYIQGVGLKNEIAYCTHGPHEFMASTLYYRKDPFEVPATTDEAFKDGLEHHAQCFECSDPKAAAQVNQLVPRMQAVEAKRKRKTKGPAPVGREKFNQKHMPWAKGELQYSRNPKASKLSFSVHNLSNDEFGKIFLKSYILGCSRPFDPLSTLYWSIISVRWACSSHCFCLSS